MNIVRNLDLSSHRLRRSLCYALPHGLRQQPLYRPLYSRRTPLNTLHRAAAHLPDHAPPRAPHEHCPRPLPVHQEASRHSNFARHRHAGPRRPLRAQDAAGRGLCGQGVRPGALWPWMLLGRRKGLLDAGRRLLYISRLRRRNNGKPDIPPSVLGPHRPRGSGASGLRPEEDQLPKAARRVLGQARSAAAQPPGQRRGHAVPHRDLLLRRGAKEDGREDAAALSGHSRRPEGYGEDCDGNSARADLLLCRGLPSAVPRKESGRVLRSRRHWMLQAVDGGAVDAPPQPQTAQNLTPESAGN
mmetsp:Transcript_17052/g.41862  ORF Transcript_17052/g.41862 Transcript_17052/m.41862 type:complete len:300 (-) Transcript_17052:135-1034(-)